MRLFVGIVPDKLLCEVLQRQIGILRTAGLQGNFTVPENLHLTLAFIGQTHRLDDVIACLESIQMPAFALSLWKLGRFSQKDGDVYYAGVQPNSALSGLAAQIVFRLRQEGFTLQERTFLPHITLCRTGRKCREFNFFPYEDVPLDGRMWVDTFWLMCSERVRDRLIYTPVYSKKLIS